MFNGLRNMISSPTRSGPNSITTEQDALETRLQQIDTRIQDLNIEAIRQQNQLPAAGVRTATASIAQETKTRKAELDAVRQRLFLIEQEVNRIRKDYNKIKELEEDVKVLDTLQPRIDDLEALSNTLVSQLQEQKTRQDDRAKDLKELQELHEQLLDADSAINVAALENQIKKIDKRVQERNAQQNDLEQRITLLEVALKSRPGTKDKNTTNLQDRVEESEKLLQAQRAAERAFHLAACVEGGAATRAAHRAAFIALGGQEKDLPPNVIWPHTRIEWRGGVRGTRGNNDGEWEEISEAAEIKIRTWGPVPDPDTRYNLGTPWPGNRPPRNPQQGRRGRPTADDLMTPWRWCSACLPAKRQWDFPDDNLNQCGDCIERKKAREQ